jgi:S-adenosylmethionine-dependent methyltransferase
VLEWIAEPQAALQALFDCLLPGGALSLMFFNAQGLLMRNVVLGNFQLVAPAVTRRRKRSLSPQYPHNPSQVYSWLEQIGMHISAKTGVRVFHDYLQNRQLQTQKFEALLALEQHYCRQEPYVSLGRYIHVMAHKSPVKG